MKKIFITYSNEEFAEARDLAVKMAKFRGGFDKVIAYGPEDIDKEFYESNRRILDCKRGAGLWLWKPYVILKTLKEVANDGDYVFYSDSGAYFIRSVNNIIRSMGDTDIWVSDINLVEKQYTKEETFQIMGCTEDTYRNTAQIQGGFLCLKKSQKSVEFISKWLELCCNYVLLSPNNELTEFKNCSDYIAHREDQSILSLLCKKEDIKPHLDPTQLGVSRDGYFIEGRMVVKVNHGMEYPVCLILHRQRQPKYKTLWWITLKPFLPQSFVRQYFR